MDWEFSILYSLQQIHHPVLDVVMKYISLLGEGGGFWILITLLLIISRKHRFTGVQMAGAMLLSVIIGNLILKNLAARARPCWIDTSVELLVKNPWDYSFPSGHSLNGFAAATALFVNDKRMGIPALILASVIAFSRLYLFVHFPTDVLCGIVLGIVDALVVCFLLKKYKDRVGLLRKM